MNKEALKEYLLQHLPLAKPAKGGTQVVCKCMVCDTEDTKGHCYIGPFDETDSPIMYNCFRCNPNNPDKSGILNQDFMNRYNLWIPNEYQMNKSGNYIKKKIVGNKKILDLSIPIVDDKENRIKLEYINKRLGLQLTYEDMVELKLCLNLKNLLNFNEIYQYTRYNTIIDQLARNFIGALGVNNNILSLRRLVETGLDNSINKKYINYVISNNMEVEKFYMIPNGVNYLAPIHIHIAEGFFDILGIFFNVQNRNLNQQLYIAGFGKSYEESLKYIICNYPMMYTIVHLYPDLDVSEYSVRGMCNKIAPTVNEIYVHRNGYIRNGVQEKDFGVPREKIKDVVQKFK